MTQAITYCIMCRKVGEKTTNGQTTLRDDLVASIPHLQTEFDRIEIWEMGNVDNVLYDSIQMIGDTEHTVRINKLF